MPKITIEFNDQEVATVLDGLAGLPLSRAYALFQRVLGLVENENKRRAAAPAEGQPFGQRPRVVQLEKPTPTPPVAEGP